MANATKPETEEPGGLQDAGVRVEVFRQAFERLPDATAILDGERRAVVANLAARRRFGLEEGARADDALTAAGLGRTSLDLFLRTLQRDAESTQRFGVHGPTGESREIDVSGTRLRGGLVLLSLRDVTEAVRTERELVQAHRVDSLGSLTVAAIHDFSNLLTPIALLSQALVRALEPGRAADTAGEIRTLAESAIRLVRRVLQVAATGSLAPEELDVNEVLVECRSLLLHVVGDGVELTLAPSDGVETVLADRVQLEHVLLNLAANARDAMSGRGRLTIATARVRGGGDSVAITITDDGTGMDVETTRRALDPFFTTKHAAAGTGLGLANARRFVAQSGGSITVEGALGAGACITLLLPVVERAARS